MNYRFNLTITFYLIFIEKQGMEETQRIIKRNNKKTNDFKKLLNSKCKKNSIELTIKTSSKLK